MFSEVIKVDSIENTFNSASDFFFLNFCKKRIKIKHTLLYMKKWNGILKLVHNFIPFHTLTIFNYRNFLIVQKIDKENPFILRLFKILSVQD